MPKPSHNRSESYAGDYMKAGRKGEKIVTAYIQAMDEVRQVENVSKSPAFRSKGIDLIVWYVDGTRRYVEIKTDRHMHEGGNLFFELLRYYHDRGPGNPAALGWSFKSQAELLYIYATKENAIYGALTTEFRAAAKKYLDATRADTVICWVPTDKNKSTLGALIPFAYMRQAFKRIEVPEKIREIHGL